MKQLVFHLLLFLLPGLTGGHIEAAQTNITSSGHGRVFTAKQIPISSYKIVKTYPHDSAAFTQGLIFENGWLYESTGLLGQSSLRKVDLKTGKPALRHELPLMLFGEGLTLFSDTLIQLTWRNGIGFVYDKKKFKVMRMFNYPIEGWGITNDGQHLIVSDGSSNLYFWDPSTFKEIKRITVNANGNTVDRINELEFIEGEIYANIWQTDQIARISPKTGEVLGWIDLSGLLAPNDRTMPVNVLNGIAYDKKNKRIFVTGKLWPKVFEIKVIDR